MDPWKHESQFGDFIAESSTFPTAPPSPSPDHQPSQPRDEDLEAFQQTLKQLQKLESYLKQHREDTKNISQLITFMKGSRKISSLGVPHQFERLRPLRTWLFWLPVQALQQHGESPGSLLTIAYYYTAALLMERLFPEIGAAYFGSLSIGPVEQIARRLKSLNDSHQDLQTPLNLMKHPIDIVHEFRSRMGWMQPVRTPSFPQYSPPANFYMCEGSPVMQNTTAMSSAEFLPYGDNVAFSYSTEDLSVIPSETAAPHSAISPLQLSSPFAHPQYLNIPSPSYGGYSPASSTYGDFEHASPIVYSDHEDNGLYGMGYPAASPMMGSANTYGVGFVTPMQTVWTQT